MTDEPRFEDGPDATVRAFADAWRRIDGARSLVLVEGVSDQIAVTVAADVLGVDLTAVVVVPINGAQAIGRIMVELDRRVPGAAVVALCDARELPYLERARAASADAGRVEVHVCRADLEDELVRAAGEHLVLEVFAAGGDATSFRTMRRQTAWRDRPFDEQAHRFIRAGARRSQRYAEALLRSLPPERVPPPLRDTIASIDRTRRAPGD